MALPRRARAGGSSRSAIRWRAPSGSPAASARAAEATTESISWRIHLDPVRRSTGYGYGPRRGPNHVRRTRCRDRGRARAADRSALPEPLRWDAERPVEARGRVLPRDDHRHLRDGVVVVVPLHTREELVVDVLARVRDCVRVFERYLLRVAEERTLPVVVERLQLLRRDAEPAAHGSIGVLSELAAVPPGDATVEQRPEGTGHALRLLLEGGPHRRRGAEVRRVARVEEVWIKRLAPELALFVERFPQVLRERLLVDGRNARFPVQHGHLLHVQLCGVRLPVKSHSPRAAS